MTKDSAEAAGVPMPEPVAWVDGTALDWLDERRAKRSKVAVITTQLCLSSTEGNRYRIFTTDHLRAYAEAKAAEAVAAERERARGMVEMLAVLSENMDNVGTMLLDQGLPAKKFAYVSRLREQARECRAALATYKDQT